MDKFFARRGDYTERHGDSRDPIEFEKSGSRIVRLLDAYSNIDRDIFSGQGNVFTVNRHKSTPFYYYESPAVFENSHSKTLWQDKVISLFLRAWYFGTRKIQDVVTTKDSARYLGLHVGDPDRIGDGGNEFALSYLESIKDFFWCDRILLRDTDYTNINFVGFMLSAVFMVLIVLLSWPKTVLRSGKDPTKYFLTKIPAIYAIIETLLRYAASICAMFVLWYRQTLHALGDQSFQMEGIVIQNIHCAPESDVCLNNTFRLDEGNAIPWEDEDWNSDIEDFGPEQVYHHPDNPLPMPQLYPY
ncbi:hypothetical protein H072_1552 [Dactylellina haptotyla CBS 200.50]|uniref:Uncharacterized protein n=1 Tax=Dactylellina haptotyla (strain CBS 200.50) TaxID=1284197 RepID=S8AU25_DACHA|nr:hypothetical protein H072_1552 [Dactylellina haptotyla CBS 200.50]